MLYILFGEDDFSLSQSLEEIKTGMGDQSLVAANTTTIDGQQMTVWGDSPASASQWASTLQLLAGRGGYPLLGLTSVDRRNKLLAYAAEQLMLLSREPTLLMGSYRLWIEP